MTWQFFRLFRKKKKIILYCDDALDAVLFRNVQKHLNPIQIVAKNRQVRKKLNFIGYSSRLMPSFPDAVIMFRNTAWKFPCRKIIKIGFDHGAYNFKRFSKAYYYNRFDAYFMSSEAEVARAQKRGIKTVRTIGFPKIDPVFDGSIGPQQLRDLAARIGLDPKKKTLLFSSTWDGSGMSAVHIWYKRISSLKDHYNLMVTVHAWMSETYRKELKNNRDLLFIDDYEILQYIMIADVCIGDTNSLLAEFCLLDKPIITFRVPATARTMPDVIELIEKISIRIDTFEELAPAVEKLLNNGDTLSAQRKEAVKITLGEPDGKAGLRAADEIIKLLPELCPAPLRADAKY
jgi:Putative glycosyl/glycerophosphate transferases involved in teichoic acid biosynthesis TagF/TagB/EpsJ/RodC